MNSFLVDFFSKTSEAGAADRKESRWAAFGLTLERVRSSAAHLFRVQRAIGSNPATFLVDHPVVTG
jgi:hypothetical protein